MDLASLGLGGGESDDLIAPRAHKEPPEFDITAMVDLVFMMNIYFIVAFVTMALSEIDLPNASHVAPLDPESATVITLVGGGERAAGRLFGRQGIGPGRSRLGRTGIAGPRRGGAGGGRRESRGPDQGGKEAAAERVVSHFNGGNERRGREAQCGGPGGRGTMSQVRFHCPGCSKRLVGARVGRGAAKHLSAVRHESDRANRR